ncbi:MAG: hypothetical protein ACTSUK_07250 [Promethearchaeota archaeon]
MRLLEVRPFLSIQDVANECRVSYQKSLTVLNSLIEQGHVVRKKEQREGKGTRRYLYRISEKGRKRL